MLTRVMIVLFNLLVAIVCYYQGTTTITQSGGGIVADGNSSVSVSCSGGIPCVTSVSPSGK
jgi:hypothetical protein